MSLWAGKTGGCDVEKPAQVLVQEGDMAKSGHTDLVLQVNSGETGGGSRSADGGGGALLHLSQNPVHTCTMPLDQLPVISASLHRLENRK